MAAATSSMSRNSHLYRSLLRFKLHQWRSFSSPSSPSPLPSSFVHRSLPFLDTISLRDHEVRIFGFYQRYLNIVSSSSGNGDGSSSVAAQSSGDDSSDGANPEGSQQSGNAGKSIRGSPVSWMSLFLLLVMGAGIVYHHDWEKKQRIEEISNASNTVRHGPSVGQAAIGGPFSLINHEGKKVTDKDFQGKWTVIYLGLLIALMSSKSLLLLLIR